MDTSLIHPFECSLPPFTSFSPISLSRLPLLVFEHNSANNLPKMDENTARRPISTASLSSGSMPRTPISAAWDRSEYYWSDSGRAGPFVSEYDGSEGSSTPASLTCSSTVEVIEHPGSERWFDKDIVHQPTSSRIQSMVAPTTVFLPTRSPSSGSMTARRESGVRLWPQPPTSNTYLSEGGLRLTANDPDSEPSDASDTTESASEDGGLRRRRHIRRPGRAPPRLPRPLPPLPATTLTHSQSTAGRFMTAPTEDELLTSVPRDSLQRAYTTNWTTAKTPTSTRLPPQKTPAKMPQLRLSTLGLRSSASDASAVLVKTPNRKFNAAFSVAPPMPADAANTIDWDLLDNALEIDGDMDATPLPADIPRPRYSSE